MQAFSQIVQCERCGLTKPQMEMSHCSFRGKVTYECMSKCMTPEEIKAKDEAELQKELIVKFGNLPKEEQLEAMYGVSFDDLEDTGERYRDASYHYLHTSTGERYTWCWGSNYWRKSGKSGIGKLYG